MRTNPPPLPEDNLATIHPYLPTLSNQILKCYLGESGRPVTRVWVSANPLVQILTTLHDVRVDSEHLMRHSCGNSPAINGVLICSADSSGR